MEMSDAEGSCWNFADCWLALFGLGGAQSQAEPAAPITRQSKLARLGTSRAGAEVPRIDAKHSGDSSEREPDLAKASQSLYPPTPGLGPISIFYLTFACASGATELRF